MINSKEARENAKQALGNFLPEAEFNLTSLKPPPRDGRGETWVYRAKVKGKDNSFICKTAARTPDGRWKIRNQFRMLETRHPKMSTGKYRVPKPMEYYWGASAMVIEDAKGISLLDQWGSLQDAAQASPLLESSGQWLAHFQGQTQKQSQFNPKPHMKWLSKAKAEHETSARVIPNFQQFTLEFNKLADIAAKAKGQPATRCVTHRDFHLGNIILRNSGEAYGIDFENKKEDDALRDYMSFIFNATIQFQGSWDNLRYFSKGFDAFHKGYNDQITSDYVWLFFQKFTAINAWSNLGPAEKMGENKAHRFKILKELACTDHPRFWQPTPA